MWVTPEAPLRLKVGAREDREAGDTPNHDRVSRLPRAEKKPRNGKSGAGRASLGVCLPLRCVGVSGVSAVCRDALGGGVSVRRLLERRTTPTHHSP
jgi:hypothetical protein